MVFAPPLDFRAVRAACFSVCASGGKIPDDDCSCATLPRVLKLPLLFCGVSSSGSGPLLTPLSSSSSEVASKSLASTFPSTKNPVCFRAPSRFSGRLFLAAAAASLRAISWDSPASESDEDAASSSKSSNSRKKLPKSIARSVIDFPRLGIARAAVCREPRGAGSTMVEAMRCHARLTNASSCSVTTCGQHSIALRVSSRRRPRALFWAPPIGEKADSPTRRQYMAAARSSNVKPMASSMSSQEFGSLGFSSLWNSSSSGTSVARFDSSTVSMSNSSSP
mmetsp:Transcript_59167/g.118760  ORF Transcript_59167/g.118760 Transcript_59167/m.118760 type:complete len:279 (-) Transcript_59167:99-935(-)